MTAPALVLLAILALVVLWLAYRIGRILLRVLAGLVFLALVGAGILHVVLR